MMNAIISGKIKKVVKILKGRLKLYPKLWGVVKRGTNKIVVELSEYIAIQKVTEHWTWYNNPSEDPEVPSPFVGYINSATPEEMDNFYKENPKLVSENENENEKVNFPII